MLMTLATSTTFIVELDDVNLANSLQYILSIFDENKPVKNVTPGDENAAVNKNSSNVLKGLSQLCVSIDSLRPPFFRNGNPDLHLFYKCILFTNDYLIDAIRILDEYHTVITQAKATAGGEGIEGDNEENLVTNTKLKQDYLYSKKIHNEVYEVFHSLARYKHLFGLIDHNIRAMISDRLSCFCPIFCRFFFTTEHMINYRKHELTFTTALVPFSPYSSSFHQQQVMEQVERDMFKLTQELIPNYSYEEIRNDIRQRLQDIIVGSGLVPFSATVALYGSSKNNFGSHDADVDMCIVLPQLGGGETRSHEEKGKLMENIGEYLKQCNYINVETISTARIPVVHFRDPKHGIDCDVTYYNPLAIRNTA